MKRCDPSKTPLRLPRDPSTVSNQHPVFSPDGDWVVWAGLYAGPAPDVDLLITKADGSGPVIKLTNTPGPVGETHPEFSPDGTQLAFSSNRDKTGDGILDDQDVYLMRVFERDAEGNLVLTPESATNVPASSTDAMADAATGVKTNERWPAWSPDGRSIAVWSGLVAATWDLGRRRQRSSACGQDHRSARQSRPASARLGSHLRQDQRDLQAIGGQDSI